MSPAAMLLELAVTVLVMLFEVNYMNLEPSGDAHTAYALVGKYGWWSFWYMRVYVTPISLLVFGFAAGILDRVIYKIFSSRKSSGNLMVKILRVIFSVLMWSGLIGGLTYSLSDPATIVIVSGSSWWFIKFSMPISALFVLRYLCASFDELFAYAVEKAEDDDARRRARRNAAGATGAGAGGGAAGGGAAPP